MNWFYNFIKNAVKIYICTKYKIEVIGKENIPAESGFMMASNHAYGFDPFLLSLGTNRMLRFLAKAELSDNFFFGWFFKALGIVSVERGKGSKDVMQSCSDIISEGGILAIFPEGTRLRGTGFGKPKSGMSVIAKLAKADILPCCIIAPQNVKWGDSIKVIFGKIIPYDELNIDVDSPRTLKAATRTVWSEILKLAGAEDEK